MNKHIVLLLALLLAFSGFSETNKVERPRIGLVLGGGGALGISHVGILRVLEEERVPIDYIVGTSMGAIIGGLYASGLSPDEIEAFLKGLDWKDVLADESPRQELYFRRKLDEQRYLIQLGWGENGLQLGTGLAAGQKLSNHLQYQVQRSSMITEFDELPIPYRAVATDLISGGPYVIDHGNLSKAMRASMAVPGIFTAVELHDRILVDGGVVNNLPVDVARDLGADIVIAVDVGAEADKVDRDSLKRISGVLARTYAIAQRPNQLEMLKQADIGIQPELTGYSPSQFEKVQELVTLGEQAGGRQRGELDRYSLSAEEYQEYLSSQRRPAPVPFQLTEVKVYGNERVHSSVLEDRIKSKPGARDSPEHIGQDLRRLYGVGEFEQVLYHLTRNEDDTGTLEYEVKEKPYGPLYFSIGLNMRSDFEGDSDWNMLFSLDRRCLNDFGAEWRNELIIGNTQSILSEFYQPLDYGSDFFVAPSLLYRSELQDLYDNKNRIAEYDVKRAEAALDFGIQFRQYAELRAGPVWGNGRVNVETGDSGLPELDEQYFGPRVQLVIDQLDRLYFPRKGYSFSVEGVFLNEELGGESSFDSVEVKASLNQSVGDHTFVLDMEYGDSLGSTLPPYAEYTLGGVQSFLGLAQDQLRGSSLAVLSLGYQYRILQLPAQLGKGVYAVVRSDNGNVWEEDIDTDDIRHGIGAGLGVDTFVGPFYLLYGVAEGGYRRLYFSIGSRF